MTKSELKTGMIVTLRDGNEYVFLKDFAINNDRLAKAAHEGIIVDGDNKRWMRMDSYNDNLTMPNKRDNELDIMKVEIPEHPYSFTDFQYCRNLRKTIWERTPPKKLTVSEIEAILGYKVEIVSEEKEN